MRAQHGARAKLCAKLIKYPNIEDYVVSTIVVIGSLVPLIARIALVQIALKDHDEKQLFMIRQHLHDVRNVYAILFDILQKVRRAHSSSLLLVNVVSLGNAEHTKGSMASI